MKQIHTKYLIGWAIAAAFTGQAWANAGNKALAVPPQAKAPMTKEAYESAKDRIEAQHKADRKLCGQRKGDAKDLCEKQADGREKAEKALLEARYKRSPEALLEARIAVADANYAVEKEKCEALKGSAQNRCQKQARQAREAAVRHARVEKVDSTGGIFGPEAATKAKAAAAPRS